MSCQFKEKSNSFHKRTIQITSITTYHAECLVPAQSGLQELSRGSSHHEPLRLMMSHRKTDKYDQSSYRERTLLEQYRVYIMIKSLCDLEWLYQRALNWTRLNFQLKLTGRTSDRGEKDQMTFSLTKPRTLHLAFDLTPQYCLLITTQRCSFSACPTPL